MKISKNLISILVATQMMFAFTPIKYIAINDDISYFGDFGSLRWIGYDQSNISTYNYGYSKVNISEYPTSYDMRELGLVSSTNSQGNYGTCWAFSTIESALSGILAKDPFANFSEWHLAYFTYTGDDAIELYIQDDTSDAFTMGGNSAFSIATLSKWIGFAGEDVAPYNSSKILSEDLKYSSEYHITDAYSFNGAFSTNTSSAYSKDDIKQLILDGHSVMLNMYFNSSSDYYSKYDNSYYYPNNNTTVNHGVTIVGWNDDFYSYDGLANQPTSSGAWLVKNSWGYDFGDYGYCWLSYENLPMIDATAYIIDSNENYSNNYYLDSYGWTTSINSLNESSRPNSASKYYDYASNVFTFKGNEDICAVSIYTTDYDVDYTVSIYTNLTDENNPTSGTLQSTTSGTQHYMGYHTISLDTPVSVKDGEKCSVVVRLKNPSYTNTLAVESSIRFFDVIDGVANVYSYNVSQENILNSTQPCESFVSNNGSTWTDIRGISGIMSNYDTDFTYEYNSSFDISTLSDGNYAISTLGNVCIKAFTNPKDKVYFSQYGGNLYTGETIELSNPKDNATIYYTLDGSTPNTDSLIYTQPITFTGQDLNISARVYIDGIMGDVYIEKFSESEAVLSTLCIKEYNGSEYTHAEAEVSLNGEPNTTIYFDCKEDTTSINIYPISTGSISIANDEITSGHETQSIDIYDGMVIPITVSKDYSTTMNYNLIINKPSSTKELLGDVDLSSALTIKDMLMMKKYILGTETFTNEQISIGDFNYDSRINIIDLLYLKKTILGI